MLPSTPYCTGLVKRGLVKMSTVPRLRNFASIDLLRSPVKYGRDENKHLILLQILVAKIWSSFKYNVSCFFYCGDLFQDQGISFWSQFSVSFIMAVIDVHIVSPFRLLIWRFLDQFLNVKVKFQGKTPLIFMYCWIQIDKILRFLHWCFEEYWYVQQFSLPTIFLFHFGQSNTGLIHESRNFLLSGRVSIELVLLLKCLIEDTTKAQLGPDFSFRCLTVNSIS